MSVPPSDRREPTAPADAIHEEVWLLGHPPLGRYLNFVDEMAIDGHLPRSQLVAEWRVANEYFAQLEETEAGIADDAEVCQLDPKLRPLIEEVVADARYRQSFDTLPTRFGMVDLDRLMIGHPYVSLHHVERLKSQLAKSPTPEDLFRFCLPLDRAEAEVKVRQIDSRRFLFWSPSSDFRFLEGALLRPEQISGYETYGSVAALVGLFVGFGSNFLNVIEANNRLLIHNGHHRAYALRDLGITHAPCIVQTATCQDELQIAAARAVLDKPSLYFRDKRPPLLKDFFDPKFRKVVRVRQMMNMVEVSYEARRLKKIVSFEDE